MPSPQSLSVVSFADAFLSLSERGRTPNLLLGNGFSIAYDHARFSYDALANAAETRENLPSAAIALIDNTGTTDFETIMRSLDSTLITLRAIDAKIHASTISEMEQAITKIREALAHAVAGLHPNRPFDIEQSRYLRTRQFLDKFESIYTVSYDLLLYWCLMQELEGHPSKAKDDGFRDSGELEDGTVKWDLLKGNGQSVHYLHGALHLFQAKDGLRKVTWSRTDLPLIDQIRTQLRSNRFPVFVSEGQSLDKLDKINRNAYLSRSLRSLGNCARPLVIFGHSLDSNDSHILDAIARSKVRDLAVSIYGDPNSSSNAEIIKRARSLALERASNNPNNPLNILFYDANSCDLW